MEGVPVDKSEFHDMSICLSGQDYTIVSRDAYSDSRNINTRERLKGKCCF